VTVELASAARLLLAGPAGAPRSSQEIAKKAAEACERLSQHLSRLIGESGIRALLRRSIVLASAEIPWLSNATTGLSMDPGASPCSALRASLELQEPDAATDAFVAVLGTFVGLLKRFVGEGLVERLLHEVWPSVFPDASKETP